MKKEVEARLHKANIIYMLLYIIIHMCYFILYYFIRLLLKIKENVLDLF